jgi:hypothetical protein
MAQVKYEYDLELRNKIVRTKINWLDEINHMTVEDAIAYLSTLPKDHQLSVKYNIYDAIEGSLLFKRVLETREDMLSRVIKTIDRDIQMSDDYLRNFPEGSESERIKQLRVQREKLIEELNTLCIQP